MQEPPLRGLITLVALAATLCLPACSRESLRVALEAQQRADRVQDAVFDRQHESLCILLYRDLGTRLEKTGAHLTGDQRAALNDAWNDRDLVEFWALQHERARALRLIGVDAKLYGDQSIADLLFKSLAVKVKRAQQGIANYAGRNVGEFLTAEERR